MSLRPKTSFALDLRWFERLLSPPALAGRWWAWRCLDCNEVTLLDQRVEQMPSATLMRRLGLAKLRCRSCGSGRLELCGCAIS